MNYYIADTHFRHSNILKFDSRPFFTLEEMEKEMIENWNNVVNNRIEQPDEAIEYDKDEWRIPENLSTWISELEKKSIFSTEEKILLLYQKLCRDFTYDDNLISYIRKSDDDTFLLPDWYGRDTDEKWTENREQHNRRVCFELSRYLATSLNELLKNKEGYHTCILWDKGLTHYFVGLTCGEYSITLDTDDFNNIKDLTRLKTGLTAEGIKVWEDEEGKFQRALDQFNKKRDRYSIERISNDIESQELEQPKEEETEDIAFLRNAIKVLIENMILILREYLNI